MAWTLVRTQNVYGSDRVVHIDCITDAATQNIDTGLKFIVAHHSGYQSCSTGGVKIYANSNASGVQSNGILGCSGFATGDELYITVYGR